MTKLMVLVLCFPYFTQDSGAVFLPFLLHDCTGFFTGMDFMKMGENLFVLWAP
jgi:hypothetical protein